MRTSSVGHRVEVAVGGAAGTLLRAGLAATAIALTGADLAAAVAVVLAGNVAGAYALGWLVARATSDPWTARWVPAVGSGGLGSLTTFSALALQLADLLAAGALLSALGLAAASVVSGVAAARAGARAGRRPDAAGHGPRPEVPGP